MLKYMNYKLIMQYLDSILIVISLILQYITYPKSQQNSLSLLKYSTN